MVQLTYKVQMKFIVKTNESHTQNNFIFLGTTGQLRKINLRNP